MKNNNFILIGIVALLVLGGGAYLMSMNSSAPSSDAVMEGKKPAGSSGSMGVDSTDSTDATEAGKSEDEASKEKAITMAEIEKHAVKTDCWFAIDNNVYDVTQYIAGGKHGGGDAIIQGCGKDATELFNTRPMGSGTPHSDKARSFLPNFKIGVLSK